MSIRRLSFIRAAVVVAVAGVAAWVSSATAYAQVAPDPAGTGAATQPAATESTAHSGLPLWALVVIAVGIAAVAAITTHLFEHGWQSRHPRPRPASA